MSRYNAQKRATLDRLTLKYQLRTREFLRRETEILAHSFHQALEHSLPSFEPNVLHLVPTLTTIFEAHRDNVIHVAVSDGMQEVSPENKLGLWTAFPFNFPIEETLGTELGKKRDEIVKKYRTKVEGQNTYKIGDLVSTQLGDYLKALKQAYRGIAQDWLAGQGTVRDVIEGLRWALQKSDNSAERIFRTETTNYFNESRHDYFSQNTAVDYMELYAVTDGRISKICEDRHRSVVTIAEAGLKKYMPAFHPHCRTVQRPLISKLLTHKRIIDEGLKLRERESSWEAAAW
jgi:SPP1 gp7 family putative phage head morphogenesis protein